MPKTFSVERKSRTFLIYGGPTGRLLFGARKGINGGFTIKFNFSGGAGYHTGRTLFLAYNSGSREWVNLYRGGRSPWTGREYSWLTRVTGIEAGLTRNANAVPWAAS